MMPVPAGGRCSVPRTLILVAVRMSPKAAVAATVPARFCERTEAGSNATRGFGSWAARGEGSALMRTPRRRVR